MAPVPPPPSFPVLQQEKKRKRKHSKSSSISLRSSSSALTSSSLSPSSSVTSQLKTLENWHRALTIDLRELRREGFRVRLELEKLNNTVEGAVERAEECAVRAQTAQDELATVNKAMDKIIADCTSQCQVTEAQYSIEMKRLKKQMMLLHAKVDTSQDNHLTEEMVMTQLMQFQEQYEKELMKVHEEHQVVEKTHEGQLRDMARLLTQLQTEKNETKRIETLENTVQSLKTEHEQWKNQVEQMVTRQEMETLQQDLYVIKSDKKHEQRRMKVRSDTCKNRLDDVERKSVDMDNKIKDVESIVKSMHAAVSAPAHLMQTPLSPSRFPSDFVRQADLVKVHDELRRINKDFQAVTADLISLAQRTDVRESQPKQHAETELQELSTQLFDALDHDSRLHAAENTRLKDVIYDMQNSNCEISQRLRRLEDDLRQATAARAQAKSPEDRGRGPASRYGQHAPPLLPTQPLLPATSRNGRERSLRCEPVSASSRSLAPASKPPPQDRGTRPLRETNRSRSRSPPRRLSWGTSDTFYSDIEPAAADHRGSFYRHNNQRYDRHSGNGVNAARNASLQPMDFSQGVCEDTGRNMAEHYLAKETNACFRRNRQPRRIPEVIVIDEDDHEHHVETEDAVTIVQSRGPSDVAMDGGVWQPGDDIMVRPKATTNIDHIETVDLLQKEEDLETGFWLYFCLGGAPDLDVQWTTCFTQLKTDECVEMPRVLRFQRRYIFLQSFPVYLTQCILQAVIVTGQSVQKENDAKVCGIAVARNAQDIHAKFDDVVKDIHLLWANSLAKYLTKRASAIDDLAVQKLELSVNPAGLSSTADKDDVIYEWTRCQESVMWHLARQLHHGSFLPAMTCNVDASPSVYLFTLMFDVLTVTSECPQSGSFRLNDNGSKLVAHLWDHTLTKLPYVFFADWTWLEDQSTNKVIPALAFCHILVSILLWNSAIDHHSLANRSIYAAAVKHILPKMYVGGNSVHEVTTDVGSLQLAKWESSHIELLDLDSKFASTLGLDGFFEVTEAIQNNMHAVAGAA